MSYGGGAVALTKTAEVPSMVGEASTILGSDRDSSVEKGKNEKRLGIRKRGGHKWRRLPGARQKYRWRGEKDGKPGNPLRDLGPRRRWRLEELVGTGDTVTFPWGLGGEAGQIHLKEY